MSETNGASGINFIHGDATNPVGDGNKVIAHICNNKGGFGAGFTNALSRRWKSPEACYRIWFRKGSIKTAYDDERVPFNLGEVSFVPVMDAETDDEPSLYIANMIAQDGYMEDFTKPPIRYDALALCLHSVAEFAKKNHASVHIPDMIGCGLAGGDRTVVVTMIEKALCQKGVSVTAYSITQQVSL